MNPKAIPLHMFLMASGVATSLVASPRSVVEFVPASEVHHEICLESCDCSAQYSSQDEVIELTHSLIYRSNTVCDTDGFCNTYFMNVVERSCKIAAATKFDGLPISEFDAARYGMIVDADTTHLPMIFTTKRRGSVDDFIFFERANGEILLDGDFDG